MDVGWRFQYIYIPERGGSRAGQSVCGRGNGWLEDSELNAADAMINDTLCRAVCCCGSLCQSWVLLLPRCLVVRPAWAVCCSDFALCLSCCWGFSALLSVTPSELSAAFAPFLGCLLVTFAPCQTAATGFCSGSPYLGWRAAAPVTMGRVIPSRCSRTTSFWVAPCPGRACCFTGTTSYRCQCHRGRAGAFLAECAERFGLLAFWTTTPMGRRACYYHAWAVTELALRIC
jgi:hypothetical protein